MVYRSTAKDVSSWMEIRRVAVSGMDVGEKLRFLKREIAFELGFERPVSLGGTQGIDCVNGVGKQDAVAVLTSGVAQSGSQMGFSDHAGSGMMQRIFRSASRRETFGKHSKGGRPRRWAKNGLDKTAAHSVAYVY